MFRWTMGTGGIGDAAKEVSDAYKTGYDTIVALVYLVLRDINTLINDEIKAMIEQGEKALGGDAAIEAAGGGPEDPLADIGAGIYTAYRLYKLYKIVRTIQYAHPVFTRAGIAAQRRVAEISGGRSRTHFAGAYWGWGFHEDGVVSGLRVARELGVDPR